MDDQVAKLQPRQAYLLTRFRVSGQVHAFIVSFVFTACLALSPLLGLHVSGLADRQVDPVIRLAFWRLGPSLASSRSYMRTNPTFEPQAQHRIGVETARPPCKGCEQREVEWWILWCLDMIRPFKQCTELYHIWCQRSWSIQWLLWEIRCVCLPIIGISGIKMVGRQLPQAQHLAAWWSADSKPCTLSVRYHPDIQANVSDT